jgi:hypothetical protein
MSTQINGARIKDNSIPPLKLTEAVGRPVDGGVLSDFNLLFGPENQKKFSIQVTSDVALTLDGASVADSRIYITAVGDGVHTLSFPSEWIIDEGGKFSFNPNATNKIQLDYDGDIVVYKILHLNPVVLASLTSAIMNEGTDDLNLSFNNSVTITTAGWTVTASGGAVTVSSVVSGSGTATVVLDLSRNIASGENMTISYNPSTGNTLSSTGNELAAITDFFVNTGVEELPSNVITVGSGMDYTTIQGAASVATTGQIVQIKGGTYRETIIPANNGVRFQPFPGETVIISGLELAGNTGWSVHSSNIYKKTITLPLFGSSSTLTSNTTLLANQVFKDGIMMHEARYPNIDTPDDLMLLNKMRHRSQTVTGNSFKYTTLNDTGLPNSSSFSLTGGRLIAFGWFWPHTRTITSHSGTQIGYSNISSNDDYGQKYRQWYYVTGKLGLLTAEKEWHYGGTGQGGSGSDPANTLYFWQPGGGSPTGVEYKARNWGFDLRNKSNITIIGLTFIGCDPAHGDDLTNNCTIDNIRATYMNHDQTYGDNFPGYGNAVTTATTSGVPKMGTKLIGANNIIENSEFRWSASAVAWVGQSGRIENNLFEDIGYSGAWGAPASFAGLSDNVVITRNTFRRTGRSGVDMGYSYTGNTQPQNLNIEVSYNDFSGWCALNVDGGAIYAWGFRDLTGGKYHHNWFHDDGVISDPTGTKLDGGQRAVYFDQGTGPVTVHHNVFWNLFDVNTPNDMQDSQDIYSQMEFTGDSGYHRNSGGNFFYNNTIVSQDSHHSYATYETKGTKDVFRNNVFRKIINLRWGLQGVGYAPNEQYNHFAGQSTNQSAAALGTGSSENVDLDTNYFLESGTGGLYYRLHASSPALNAGTPIAGITETGNATPDIGAYETGDDWVPGYNAVAVDDDVYIQNDNLSFTTYSETPTVQNNSVYKGGTASYFSSPAIGQTITVIFTGTGFELFAEKYNHAAIISVSVDGGAADDYDLYVASTTNNSTSIVEVTGLSAGQHTVEFEVTSKNASSSNYYFVYDAIRVID